MISTFASICSRTWIQVFLTWPLCSLLTRQGDCYDDGIILLLCKSSQPHQCVGHCFTIRSLCLVASARRPLEYHFAFLPHCSTPCCHIVANGPICNYGDNRSILTYDCSDYGVVTYSRGLPCSWAHFFSTEYASLMHISASQLLLGISLLDALGGPSLKCAVLVQLRPMTLLLDCCNKYKRYTNHKCVITYLEIIMSLSLVKSSYNQWELDTIKKIQQIRDNMGTVLNIASEVPPTWIGKSNWDVSI